MMKKDEIFTPQPEQQHGEDEGKNGGVNIERRSDNRPKATNCGEKDGAPVVVADLKL